MRKMFPLIVLLLHVCAVYSDSHSLRYYHTVVSAPGSGLPVYSSVGYVDNRVIVIYNSDSRRTQPKIEWMKKQEPEYWERETQNAKDHEAVSKHNVKILMSRFNQTEGFHSFQEMYGCELGDDGKITGHSQYGYDGREFMFLDTKTGTYIPTMHQAQITTQRWNNPEIEAGERYKNYLETECIEYLKKYVENGREDLERRVLPKVKVSGQEKDGALMLHCQVYGFHPRAVEVKWMKNGVDDIPEYETTHVLPNPDGTYQIRVTVEVIPKEGESYSCYVDHGSLTEPKHFMWEAEKPSSWLIPVIIAAVAVSLVAGIVGFVIYKRRNSDYRTTNTSETSSELSNVPTKSLIARAGISTDQGDKAQLRKMKMAASGR